MRISGVGRMFASPWELLRGTRPKDRTTCPSRAGEFLSPPPANLPTYDRASVIAWRVLAAALLAFLVGLELESSRVQSYVLSAVARRFSYRVEPGPSPRVPYPHSGPYDQRMGYARLPDMLDRLQGAGYEITAQARSSPILAQLADRLGHPIYGEKSQAGLSLLDRHGQPLIAVRYPRRAYPDFESIPPLVVESLLFIENREALDGRHPYRNPAIEWRRFGRAVLDLGYSRLNASHPVSGGSTLATQLEKVRHSPGGRTAGAADKARQVASASLRAYLGGERTLDARRRIVRDYINSMPLAAVPGHGEVTGLGDGLFAWFGADFEAVNRALRAAESAPEPARPEERARAFRRVLGLLLALKKPSAYLANDRSGLDARIDAYLRLLTAEGIVSPALRDAALRTSTGFRTRPPEPEPIPFAERKAADSVRVELSSRLGVGAAYDLDRLDLTARTTIDRDVQQEVAQLLRRLGDPDYASRAGLDGRRLLRRGDPAEVIYSFTLYESTAKGNLLRVQADSYDGPLNINEGTKLELGSTAKLRTLVHYLEIVAGLHDRWSGVPAERLRALPAGGRDRLSRWAVEYLSTAQDRTLPAMLEAALSREYSAAPRERFFTGGGVHTFENFERKDDDRVMTVREAFRRSVNLVFIRLMRDIVQYHGARLPGVTPGLFDDPGDPARRVWLARFADTEGALFLRRFEDKYRGRGPDDMLRTLAAGLRRPSANRMAVVHRSVRPRADRDEFAAFLRARLPGVTLTEKAVGELYERYDPARLSLNDRGYLAGVHPLELWLVEYRHRNPEAKWKELLAASASVRQEAYGWLFKTSHKNAQDRRIRTRIEAEAFREIHKAWKRLGFPFDSLVPSYATALGSSGDNPSALAELMGILVNDGLRRPAVRIRALRFGEGTPLETIVERRAEAGTLVLPALLAAVVKQELAGVVREGTARRIAGAVELADGAAVPVAGKTGTGDNRYLLAARGGRRAGAGVVNRTATFVFTMGDRHFGTVTAFVPGRQALGYRFTSALPVQVLRHLAPTLLPLVSAPPDGDS